MKIILFPHLLLFSFGRLFKPKLLLDLGALSPLLLTIWLWTKPVTFGVDASVYIWFLCTYGWHINKTGCTVYSFPYLVASTPSVTGSVFECAEIKIKFVNVSFTFSLFCPIILHCPTLVAFKIHLVTIKKKKEKIR